MSLVDHARRELELVGMLDADSDYGGMLGRAALELVEKFASQGHSGGSAMGVLALFDKLARHQPLTDITSNPAEWFFHGAMGPGGEDIWQNIRDSAAFSRDGGKTWYHLDDPKKCNGDTHLRPST